MGNARIQYVRREGATLEAELNALTSAYAFILDSAKKKAAPESRPDDVRKDQDAHTATKQYTR